MTRLADKYDLLNLELSPEEFKTLLQTAFDAFPQVVDQVRGGKKPQTIMSLVGDVRKRSAGRVDVERIRLEIERTLGVEGVLDRWKMEQEEKKKRKKGGGGSK